MTLTATGLVKPKRLNPFERYLTAWVVLCMGLGVLLGKALPGVVSALREMEFGAGSHINVPIAALIWLMIYPMMLKVDFASVLGVGKRPKGLLITLFVNWLVKPFSMALLGWLFFKHLFLPFIGAPLADQYTAGVIILAAAPCTAMVFVWSYLTDGDPAYTLVQVSVNDLIMLVAFAPIVTLLVSGVSALTVPFSVLLYAVILFIVIPLAAGSLTRAWLVRAQGLEWFERKFLPALHPISILALLTTLVIVFAFQADNLTGRFFHVILIAIPILIQVYFNSWLVYGLMRWFNVSHNVAAPGALIGASNFFELAVATAIALFGAGSGAALATVVGVLVEVPVMLSVCSFCNRTRHWFSAGAADGKVARMSKKVLFVCVHNSARSQMAEALLNRMCGDVFEAESAGLEPGKLNPLAVEVMREIGVDINGKQTRGVSEVIESGQRFDYVITVCDESSAEQCPIFSGGGERVHWNFPDPAKFTGSRDERLEQTRAVREAIEAKIEKFCPSGCRAVA